MPLGPKYDVYMDGSCSFCQWVRTKVEPYDSGMRLRFLDYNDPAVAAQALFLRRDFNRELHVRKPDGGWVKGFEAWQAVLCALPKFAWIGRMAAMPFLRWLGPYVYSFVARHRYCLPGSPARCESDSCAARGGAPK
jgi:predicted DCC family thiol-disulfide oxidoreductase YuxK